MPCGGRLSMIESIIERRPLLIVKEKTRMNLSKVQFISDLAYKPYGIICWNKNFKIQGHSGREKRSLILAFEEKEVYNLLLI